MLLNALLEIMKKISSYSIHLSWSSETVFLIVMLLILCYSKIVLTKPPTAMISSILAHHQDNIKSKNICSTGTALCSEIAAFLFIMHLILSYIFTKCSSDSEYFNFGNTYIVFLILHYLFIS